MRVDIAPEVLVWASARSGLAHDEIVRLFPRFDDWVGQHGDAPTLRQVESFAQRTHTPVGMLLLPAPPEEALPIPDFRTVAGQGLAQPSADLLDAVFLCEQRQGWYREHLLGLGEEPLEFVGSRRTTDDVDLAADEIRDVLGFQVSQRVSHPTWTEALRALIDLVEGAGTLVMVSGIVGSNTHRVLDPAEFRGFALVDELAPLVFINATDTKAAQIFTLAHEVAHVWLGQSAVSNPRLDRPERSNASEQWCDAVAAEVLVPLATLRQQFNASAPIQDEIQRLAGFYKASTLVVLRRIFDGGLLGWDEYRAAYASEYERLMAIVRESPSGGDFYNTQPLRASRRFSKAIIASALEGNTTYR
ncbi:MAG: hypothetical protein JWR63_746, partial [Conexibacter sp.]|nr:hypothetical protein [Conexibacter sp.]